MVTDVTRRKFLAGAGIGIAAGAALSPLSAEAAESNGPIKIVGVGCSPRKRKTTSQALAICLETAKAVAPERTEVALARKTA